MITAPSRPPLSTYNTRTTTHMHVSKELLLASSERLLGTSHASSLGPSKSEGLSISTIEDNDLPRSMLLCIAAKSMGLVPDKGNDHAVEVEEEHDQMEA